MTGYCQKCGIRTTPEEPLCQCVDVLHAEIDRLRAAFKQACEVAESAQWCLMQDVSGSTEPLKTMRANRERLLR